MIAIHVSDVPWRRHSDDFRTNCRKRPKSAILGWSFPGPKCDFDGFHNVFGGPGNSPADSPDSPDSADLPETVSGPPEQTLGSPRRGSG